MDDLDRYIEKQKRLDPEFAEGYDEGYENFRLGVILHSAREQAGLTREEMSIELRTNKSTVTHIENHPEDFRLTTLKKYAKTLGKKIRIEIN